MVGNVIQASAFGTINKERILVVVTQGSFRALNPEHSTQSLSSTPSDRWLFNSIASFPVSTHQRKPEAIYLRRLTTLHVSSSGTVYIIELESDCMAGFGRGVGYTFDVRTTKKPYSQSQ